MQCDIRARKGITNSKVFRIPRFPAGTSENPPPLSLPQGFSRLCTTQRGLLNDSPPGLSRGFTRLSATSDWTHSE